MSALVITDGFGNGTLTGSPSNIILQGFSTGDIWSIISDTSTIWTEITDTATTWVGVCSSDPGKGIIGLGRVGCMRIGKDFTNWS